jgi:tetratricopeptide (TPR) repeat protein
MALNQYDEAIRMFNHALEIDPQHDPSRKKRTEARKKRHGTNEE